MIEPKNTQLSIRRQCELLGLNRASYYHEPATETTENLQLMRRIDEQYLKTPFFGSRRMAIVLAHEGEEVNRKRVRRLMGLMGLEAIHPGPRTTVRNPDHKVYPYLLRGVAIERRDQVWSSDITYIPMHQGFMYLTAVIDWYSRYVLSWSLGILSIVVDGEFQAAGFSLIPSMNLIPRTTSVSSGEPFNDRQPFDALSISLNTIVRHAVLVPLPLVLS